jgi:peptidoglycan/LPS O-acetylase OafA/YrhL
MSPATSSPALAIHPPPRPPHQARLPSLDRLRGLAIAAVLFHHLAVYTPVDAPGHLFARLAEFCGHGVDLFFVLSGYLLVKPLAGAPPPAGWARDFWLRRVAKIVPLYALLLVVVYLLLPAALAWTGFSSKLAMQESAAADWPWYAAFASNWLNFLNGRFTNPALDVAWSLAVEAQFYLLLAAAISARLAGSARFWLGLIAIAIATRLHGHASDWNWIQTLAATPARLDAFALGALAALRPRWFRAPLRLLGCAVFAAPLFFPWSREHPAVVLLGYTWVALGCAALVAKAAERDQTSPPTTPARPSPLAFLGLISYSVYLTHLPVRAALRDIGLPAQRLLDSPEAWARQFGFYLLAGALCLLVGWLAWRLVERPAQRLLLRPRSPLPGSSS